MKLEGSTSIEAPREMVWDFLTEPDQVSQCVPGLRSMEIVTPQEHFKAVAAIGFGTAMVTFTTDVHWTRLDAPGEAAMTAHGDAPGSAVDVSAEMHLSEAEGVTTLDWEAEVDVVGTIASLAARMMTSVSKMLTNAFFNCVRKHVEE